MEIYASHREHLRGGRLAHVRWLLFVVAMSVGLTLSLSSPAQAATDGCYGAGCTGLDPQGLCDGDAYTVASEWVDGAALLEFRYSPSCRASWARISVAQNSQAWLRLLSSTGNVIDVRASVWIEGEPSQGILNMAGDGLHYTKWTGMVDGTVENCVGGEAKLAVPGATDYSPSEMSWGPWVWGPCA